MSKLMFTLYHRYVFEMDHFPSCFAKKRICLPQTDNREKEEGRVMMRNGDASAAEVGKSAALI
jgi:hypothetical protein